MKFNYTKVFVTGANGWLGRQVVQTLMEGDPEVIEEFEPGNLILRNMILKGDNEDFFKKYDQKLEIFRGDIRSELDCAKFLEDSNDGILIHTAGIIHPQKVRDFFDINFTGTMNLVEAGIAKGIRKFVIISSNSPIGCNKNSDTLFDETSPYNPYMNYGKSKEKMEKYLLKKIDEGVDITILRPPWFYGSNMPDRQMLFYKMICNGKVPVVGDGSNLRSKANVKNIVQGILLAATNPASKGQIYWIADKKPYSMNEIIETIRGVLENEFELKCKKSVIKLPYFLGQFAQLCDFLMQSVGLYHQKVHVLSEMNKNIACSIKKAENELGYNPKVDLYSGTRDALKSMPNNNLVN